MRGVLIKVPVLLSHSVIVDKGGIVEVKTQVRAVYVVLH